jgi:hypothetical protein
MNDREVTAAMLWDIEQIKQVKARFFRYIDLKMWDSLFELFTDDCEHYARSLSGDGSQIVLDNQAYVRRLVAELDDGVTAHQTIAPEVTLLGDTEAECISVFFDYAQTRPKAEVGLRDRISIMGYGHHYERFRKGEDGKWRISSKRPVRLRIDRVPWSLDGDS